MQSLRLEKTDINCVHKNLQLLLKLLAYKTTWTFPLRLTLNPRSQEESESCVFVDSMTWFRKQTTINQILLFPCRPVGHYRLLKVIRVYLISEIEEEAPQSFFLFLKNIFSVFKHIIFKENIAELCVHL